MDLDPPDLKYYAREVKRRLDQEKESIEENAFLRTSLRKSDRLKAIEDYRRIVKNAEVEKRPELNEAFEGDEGWAYSRSGTFFTFLISCSCSLPYFRSQLITVISTVCW